MGNYLPSLLNGNSGCQGRLTSTGFAIADIFKEVVWEVVTNDPYTGVTQEGSVTNSKKIAAPIFVKNQVKNYNANGQVQQVICGVQGVCLNKF